MRLLETVFSSVKFDLNDDVLVKFSDYFAEEDREYNQFSLDAEDFPALERFVQLIKHNDFASEIFVCTYGYEMTNCQRRRGTYADMLWIDTSLAVAGIEKMVTESGMEEPSEISFVVGSKIERGKTWLITRSKGGKPQIIELADRKKINRMVCVYWD